MIKNIPMEVWLYLIVLLILWLDIAPILYKYFGVAKDNCVEEIIEDVIEKKTGLEIDFSS